jgi:hypothetical protein
MTLVPRLGDSQMTVTLRQPNKSPTKIDVFGESLARIAVPEAENKANSSPNSQKTLTIP